MYRRTQMMAHNRGARVLGAVALMSDTEALAAQRDFFAVCPAGTSSERPKAGDPDVPTPAGQVQAGTLFLDVSLGFVIVSDGAGGWRNPMSGSPI